MLTTRSARAALTLWAGVALISSPAHALVLIFEPVVENYEPLDQSYGDRVISTSQDGFVYGVEGGFTPNVEADYGVLPYATPSLFRVGFGDLRDVLFDSASDFGHLEVALTADEGWNVTLSRFEMAAWRATNPINAVQVYTQAGDVLFDARDVQIAHDTHTIFSFDPPLIARKLVIAIDASNLGGLSDNIAIDNVVFGQVEATLPVEIVSWGALKTSYTPVR